MDTMPAFFVLLCLFVASQFTAAKTDVTKLHDSSDFLTVLVTHDYTLGDNDTLITAKKLIVEAAKNASSEYSGTYIESSTQANGQGITDEYIKILRAAYQKVLSEEYQKSINKTGAIVLTGKIKIKVSKKEITEGLEKLKNDPLKLEKIRYLEAENRKIKQEMDRLLVKLNYGDDDKKALIKKRAQYLKNLSANLSDVKVIFTPTLESFYAKKKAKQRRDEITLIENKNKIDDFLQLILDNTEVSIGEPIMRELPSGQFNISAPIDWKVDMDKESTLILFEELEFKAGFWGNLLSMRYDTSKANFLYDSTYQYLANKVIQVEVSLLGKTITRRIYDPQTNQLTRISKVKYRQYHPKDFLQLIQLLSNKKFYTDFSLHLMIFTHPINDLSLSSDYVTASSTTSKKPDGFKQNIIDFGVFDRWQLERANRIETTLRIVKPQP